MSNSLIFIKYQKMEMKKFIISVVPITVFSDTIHIKLYHCQWNWFDQGPIVSGHVLISWSNTSNNACCFGNALWLWDVSLQLIKTWRLTIGPRDNYPLKVTTKSFSCDWNLANYAMQCFTFHWQNDFFGTLLVDRKHLN